MAKTAVERGLSLNEHGVSPDQVKKCLEAGFDENAIAVYGASIDVLNKIIRSGELPPYSSEELLPYQRKLSNNGQDCLYFALPFTDRTRRISPVLAKEIISQFKSPQHATDNLKMDFIKIGAKFYALRQAISAYFNERTQIQADTFDILATVLQVAPRKFSSFIQEMGFGFREDDVEGESDQETVATIMARLNSKDVSNALFASLKRRGVLIYLNAGIFTNTRVYPSFEREDELVIVSQMPLRSDVISGLEVLSPEEEKEVLL